MPRSGTWCGHSPLAGPPVLLTTQYLEEADRLADGLAVIDRGRIIAQGTPAELKESVGAGAVQVRLVDPGRRDDAERVLTEVLAEQVHPDADLAVLSARLTDARRAGAALSSLARAGIEVSDFRVGHASLDEVFLALTGHHTTTETPLEATA